MDGAKLVRQGLRGLRRVPEADADSSAGPGERDGYLSPDPGAGSGDDGAQTGELRGRGPRAQWLVAGRDYSSAPEANGWRAAGVSASTLSMLGSPFTARAIDIFTAS